MTFCISTRISIRMKTGMNSFWNDWYRNKILPGIMWTDTKKYMEMEWTRSGMKVIPVSCKQLLRLFKPAPSLHLSRYLKGHKIKCFKPLRKREHPWNIWYFPCPLTHILITQKIIRHKINQPNCYCKRTEVMACLLTHIHRLILTTNSTS